MKLIRVDNGNGKEELILWKMFGFMERKRDSLVFRSPRGGCGSFLDMRWSHVAS
jgi:hypothetical protein